MKKIIAIILSAIIPGTGHLLYKYFNEAGRFLLLFVIFLIAQVYIVDPLIAQYIPFLTQPGSEKFAVLVSLPVWLSLFAIRDLYLKISHQNLPPNTIVIKRKP